MLPPSFPSDPFMLMSFVNMKLRDEFPSLDEFCAYYGVERAEVEVVQMAQNRVVCLREAVRMYWR